VGPLADGFNAGNAGPNRKKLSMSWLPAVVVSPDLRVMLWSVGMAEYSGLKPVYRSDLRDLPFASNETRDALIGVIKRALERGASSPAPWFVIKTFAARPPTASNYCCNPHVRMS